MNDFAIVKLKDPVYDCLLIYLSAEGYDEALVKVEKKLKKTLKDKHYAYNIVIDLLFVNGNCHNRFLDGYYVNGKFDFHLQKTISPNMDIRQQSTDWLYNHNEFVKNSPLTPRSREYIKRREAF